MLRACARRRTRIRSTTATPTRPPAGAAHRSLPIPKLFSRWTSAPTTSTPRREGTAAARATRSEEHTSELQSPWNLGCRLLLEKKKVEAHGGDIAVNRQPGEGATFTGEQGVGAGTRRLGRDRGGPGGRYRGDQYFFF